MEINFTIGDHTYDVPDEATLEQFERAVSWDISDFKNLEPFVATLTGAPLKELDKLDTAVFEFITGACIQRIDVSTVKVHETIKGYGLRDFDKFTFGELVDLDTYMSMSATQNVGKIASILYGAPEEETKGWPVKQVWAALVEAHGWRMRVYKEYDEFFELSGNTADDVEASEGANIQLMWFEAITILANGDFLKMHQVVERPYREALNFLTWRKAQIQKEQLEILKRKNDLSRRTR